MLRKAMLLPKTTQLLSDRAGSQTQVVWLQSPHFRLQFKLLLAFTVWMEIPALSFTLCMALGKWLGLLSHTSLVHNHAHHPLLPWED